MNKQAAVVVAALLASSAASSAVITWTDWGAVKHGVATGTINAPSGTVNVSYSDSYSFVQTGCGIAYWSPGTYNGAFNKPFDCDIVALNAGGTKTISFDTAVTNPYLALQSWNGNTVRFDAAFDVVSNGSGYWGSGTPIVDGDDMGFFGSGEVHAILRFNGTFNSISFTDTSEDWHGFTVGIADRANVVPAPATLALVLPALALVLGGAAARRRRQQG